MVAALRPTSASAGVPLDIVRVAAGERFGRIYLDRHPNPLEFGKTRSRFSDPRGRIDVNRFCVLYLGATVTGYFLEAVLRDLRNGSVGGYPQAEHELQARLYATIGVGQPLRLVALS